jgi:hypothetical protein
MRSQAKAATRNMPRARPNVMPHSSVSAGNPLVLVTEGGMLEAAQAPRPTSAATGKTAESSISRFNWAPADQPARVLESICIGPPLCKDYSKT